MSESGGRVTESVGRPRAASAGSTRVSWVDTGRGIAIILVVLFHTRNWVAGTGVDTGAWEDVNAILSSMRMPFFFVLSGLFAAKWLTAPWRELLRQKVLLFLWVLVVWSAIGITVQVSGLAAAGRPVGVTTAVRDFLLSPLSPPYELWFIWALALFFVLAKLTARIPVPLQLAVTGICAAVSLTLWFSVTNGQTGAAKFYFFFLCGMYARRFILAIAQWAPWQRIAMILLWAAASGVFWALGWRELPGVYFVNCLIGVLAGVALSTFAVRIGLLARLGRQTLPIYLAHTPIVILITIAMFALPAVIEVLVPYGAVVVPAVAAVAIAAALGLHRLAQRSVLRYLYEAPPALGAWISPSR